MLRYKQSEAKFADTSHSVSAEAGPNVATEQHHMSVRTIRMCGTNKVLCSPFVPHESEQAG